MILLFIIFSVIQIGPNTKINSCIHTSEGSMIGAVTAIDPDEDVLNYSILDDEDYLINEETGIITIGNEATEDTSSFVTVIVSDGSLNATTDIEIEVISEGCAPRLVDGQSFTVVENSEGDVILGTLQLQEFEVENGETIELNIASAIPNLALDLFELHSTSHVLKTSINSMDALDYETFMSYPSTLNTIVLTIELSYHDLIGQGLITIIIEDINEAPQLLGGFFNIAENANDGEIVGQVVSKLVINDK